jgi:hypothetical protein
MWHKITVEQYQQIYQVHQEEIEDIDKMIRIIGILYDMSESQVNDLPVPQFHKLTAEITQTFKEPLGEGVASKRIKAVGRTYQICYKPGKLRYGQWVELMHFMKGGIIPNLHLLAASVANPVRFGIVRPNKSETHGKRAEDFLQANFLETYNSVVFFYQCLIGLKKNTGGFWARVMRTEKILREMSQKRTLTPSTSGTAGSIPQPS